MKKKTQKRKASLEVEDNMKKLFILLFCLLLVFINLSVVFSEEDNNQSPQDEEIILIGKLNNINYNVPGCGIIFWGSLSEYTNLTVIQGNYSNDKIYVIHPGIEFKRDGKWGKLDKFIIGDVHKIVVTKRNVWKIECVDSGDVNPGDYPVYYCKRVGKKIE